jgi:hypothetical protein
MDYYCTWIYDSGKFRATFFFLTLASRMAFVAHIKKAVPLYIEPQLAEWHLQFTQKKTVLLYIEPHVHTTKTNT